MNERRSQPRLEDSELVTLEWEQDGMRSQQLGNVEDVSLDGMGIVLDSPLPVGTCVTVSYGQGELSAIVRHCSRLIDGVYVGIEFTGDSKGSTLHFDPKLLIWPV
jgi:PilZ domain